jgi:hypothetical protein
MVDSGDMQPVSDRHPEAIGKWLVIVLVFADLARLGLWLLYQPVPSSDTPSYRRLAEAVLNGFQHYDGTRTPGYPAFLALVGSDERVFLAQMALGIVITLLLFYIGWQLTGKAWFGGLVALAHTLNLGQLFFEANLLTETLTTLWIALTLAGVLYVLCHPQKANLWLAASIGFASVMALITRPLFIYLPFWILPFVLISPLRLSVKSALNRIGLAKGVTFILPVALILGSWLWFIHARYHTWGLTTMTGYQLVQHTGVFFEYVPDEYATLRDVYLKYRDAHIAQYGTQTNTIWEAIPALQEATGLNFYDLSRTLARISVKLILQHPGLYLKNALQGWWMFWRAPVYWSPDALRVDWLAAPLSLLIQLIRPLIFGANLIFILASLPALFIRRLREDNPGHRIFNWCLIGTIWIASVLQTLPDHGDNPRFLVPLQSFVILWVVWFFYRLYVLLKKRSRYAQMA